MGHGSAPGGQVGGREPGSGGRRNYSSAQRVYWDQLEQGAYNAYAGGLLFVPLLARYLDVFGFRSMEDFKRAYREEFGVLMGCARGP